MTPITAASVNFKGYKYVAHFKEENTLHLTVIRCPFCKGSKTHHCALYIEDGAIEYQGKYYNVQRYFYKCRSTGEEFTTNEIDQLTLKQIPEWERNVKKEL